MRATRRFTGVTTKKYTAAAINRNETTVLIKSPTGNTVVPICGLIEEKSGLPTRAPISGVSRSLVKAVTTPPNAAPITTPTAMSITLPRRMNCLNPLSMTILLTGGDHFTADNRRRQAHPERGGRTSSFSDPQRAHDIAVLVILAFGRAHL